MTRLALVVVLSLGCQHHEPREPMHPCDQTEGPHPARSADSLPFDRGDPTCKRSWSPADDPTDPLAACVKLAREEATTDAAVACYRSCEREALSWQSRQVYGSVLALVRDFPEQFTKQVDPSCSAASYSPLRGQLAREAWHCSGLPDLPPQFGVEMRLDGKYVDYLRVEGPLVSGGPSYLFTYEDVGTGCGQHAHLVQVETPPR